MTTPPSCLWCPMCRRFRPPVARSSPVRLSDRPRPRPGSTDGSAFLTVASSAPLFSQASNTQLDRLHAVAGPAGQQVLITGTAQINRDTVRAITSRLPLVLTVIALITLVVMFFFTGSVVLPLKALLLSGLSLTGRVRCTRVDLPGRPPRRIGHHRHRHTGAHHAGGVVLHRVRLVDGLRGVPRVADPRVLAGVQPDAGRQRRQRGARLGPTPGA